MDVLSKKGTMLIRKADARITAEGEMPKPVLEEVICR
jgi:hypothetical protein